MGKKRVGGRRGSRLLLVVDLFGTLYQEAADEMDVGVCGEREFEGIANIA